MARKKAYTDALNNIVSFNKSRDKAATRSLNLNNPQRTDNAVTFDALRTRRLNNSSRQQSNLLSEKELLHEKFYDTDGNLNVKVRNIYGSPFAPIIIPDIPIMSYDLNIDFNLTSIPVTSFDPEGNENDRPRINTFREDGEFVIYLSAGNIYVNSAGVSSLPPWGDRGTGSFSTSITSVSGIAGITPDALSAGVDVFASSTMLAYLTPLSTNWFISDSNPGEKKYQLLFNTGSAYDVGVHIKPICNFTLVPVLCSMASATPKISASELTGDNVFNIYQAIGTGTGFANSPALSGALSFETPGCVQELEIRVIGRADTYGTGYDTLTIFADGVQKAFFESINRDSFSYPLRNTTNYDSVVTLPFNDNETHTVTISGKSGTVANNNVGYDVKITHTKG